MLASIKSDTFVRVVVSTVPSIFAHGSYHTSGERIDSNSSNLASMRINHNAAPSTGLRYTISNGTKTQHL